MIDSPSPALIIQAKIGMGMRRDKNRVQVPHQLNGIIFPSTEIFQGLAKNARIASTEKERDSQKYKMEQQSFTVSKAAHRAITAEAAITKQPSNTVKP